MIEIPPVPPRPDHLPENRAVLELIIGPYRRIHWAYNDFNPETIADAAWRRLAKEGDLDDISLAWRWADRREAD